jgi:hypothetical protein
VVGIDHATVTGSQAMGAGAPAMLAQMTVNRSFAPPMRYLAPDRLCVQKQTNRLLQDATS